MVYGLCTDTLDFPGTLLNAHLIFIGCLYSPEWLQLLLPSLFWHCLPDQRTLSCNPSHWILFFPILQYHHGPICNPVLKDKLDNRKWLKCIECTYEVVLSGLCVSNDDKHFVVDVLVWNRIAFCVPGRLGHERVIVDLKLSICLSDNNHWLGVRINILRPGSNGNKLNVVVNSQNLAASLRFYVLFRNVLWLVVKETVRVTRPRHASHVDFILFGPTVELLNLLAISAI